MLDFSRALDAEILRKLESVRDPGELHMPRVQSFMGYPKVSTAMPASSAHDAQ